MKPILFLLAATLTVHAQSWTNRFRGFDDVNYSPVAMVTDHSGNVIVTGGADSGTNSVYITIKYSNAGVPLWTNRYAGPGGGYDNPAALAVDGADNAIVTGTSPSDPGGANY